MLRELLRDRWTIQELAGHLGLDRRTAYRYVKIVETSGIRVRQHRDGVNIYYRAERGSVLRTLGLQRAVARARVPPVQSVSRHV
jgi:predicted DNA-binding transcriptional regulator YafY